LRIDSSVIDDEHGGLGVGLLHATLVGHAHERDLTCGLTSDYAPLDLRKCVADILESDTRKEIAKSPPGLGAK